jgi:Undecaprenyl-phosphate glucose phosphotransferase
MVSEGLAILLIGLSCARWMSLDSGLDWPIALLVVALGTILSLNSFHLLGAYRFDLVRNPARAAAPVVAGWLVGQAALLGVAAAATTPVLVVDAWIALWSGLVLAALAASRTALALQIRRWTQEGRFGELVAVLGTGPIARRLLIHIGKGGDQGLRFAGLYDDRSGQPASASSCLGHRVAGSIDDLVGDIRRKGITTVIVALPLSADLRLAAALNKLSQVSVDVKLCPEEFGLQLGHLEVSHVGGLTLLNVLDRPLRDWRLVAKDIEDRVLAAVILVLIAPLMLVVALAVKLDSPGPVLFRQNRYGLNNRLIGVLKFRTMFDASRDDNAEQLTRRNDPRVTRLGAFMRRTSIDELPQFINVLRGEMSIVGPRPHAIAAKAGRLLYQDAIRFYDARHRMKPGITGWAQVNGWRGSTDTVEQIRKRVEHDLYYIENWSIGLDLRIILRTVCGGFVGRSAY